MAAMIYYVTLIVIFIAVILAGVADLVLYLLGLPTISATLRAHIELFLYPLAATEIFLLALALHLFLNR